MAGMMSIGGLSSGLKTDEIISKIIEYARRPQIVLKANKAEAQAKLAAWQDLNTRLLTLMNKCDAVADAVDFKASTATSSNNDIVTASATSSSEPGTYYIKVNSRAQNHQLSSQTFSSLDSVIGTGTIDIAFANDPTKNFSVTINTANNTLSGLRDSINRAGKDVQATIINSGTSSNPAYRLLVMSNEAGTSSQFTIDTSNLSGGIQPVVDQIIQQGEDAEITFGTGPGAITVSKSYNTITDLIPGVTLNINSYNSSETVKIDVKRDTNAIKSAIVDFVNQFNDISKVINEHFTYNSESGATGILFGDYQLQSLQMNLTAAVGSVVAGLKSQYNALATIGITTNTDGNLEINDAQLSKALNNNLDAVSRVFSSNLESNSSYVKYAASTSLTKPSGASAWAVEITRAATRGQVTAGTAMNNPLDANETLIVNGKSILLTSGMEIDDVLNKINAVSSETGVTALKTGADGTGTGNYITIRKIAYGSSQNFSVVSNRSYTSGNTTGFGNVLVAPNVPLGESGVGQGVAGQDVAGTINGAECTGVGQILTCNPSGTTNSAKGLSLVITSESTLSTTVNFTKGIGASLRDLLSSMTSSGGIVTTTQNSLTSEISEIDKNIADMETKVSMQEDRLYKQFNNLEAKLAKLTQQGNYLLAQITAMNKSK